jgi:hypothetical protein
MALVESIINSQLSQAQLKASLAQSYSEIAIQAATGTADYRPARVAELDVREPRVFIPTQASGVDVTLFDSIYARIIEDLADRHAQMLDTYFAVDPQMMAAAEEWIRRAIADGGSGINALVEARLWQRDRDRITVEASASTDEAMAQWSAKGYPLPPGAANATLQAIQRKRSADVAAVSRDTAIKAFETEIENVRFAVNAAIDYRTKALGAAGDYIRALASAPDVAARLSTQSADAQARLISAAGSFFSPFISRCQSAVDIETSSSAFCISRAAMRAACSSYSGYRSTVPFQTLPPNKR